MIAQGPFLWYNKHRVWLGLKYSRVHQTCTRDIAAQCPRRCYMVALGIKCRFRQLCPGFVSLLANKCSLWKIEVNELKFCRSVPKCVGMDRHSLFARTMSRGAAYTGMGTCLHGTMPVYAAIRRTSRHRAGLVLPDCRFHRKR